jgi:hypothetical protein
MATSAASLKAEVSDATLRSSASALSRAITSPGDDSFASSPHAAENRTGNTITSERRCGLISYSLVGVTT